MRKRAAAPSAANLARLRRRQVIGILIVAAAILSFTLLRTSWHALFPPGWWRW